MAPFPANALIGFVFVGQFFGGDVFGKSDMVFVWCCMKRKSTRRAGIGKKSPLHGLAEMIGIKYQVRAII